ncbi:ParB N-terminal domain-containing protein [Staphylococcus aureus]
MKKPFSKLFGLKNKDDIIGHIEEDRNSNVESITELNVSFPTVINQDRCLNQIKLKNLLNQYMEHGLLQPIVVRPIEEDMFEIIAGERRFRAIQSLNLPKATLYH